jgi:hypothetical protein
LCVSLATEAARLRAEAESVHLTAEEGRQWAAYTALGDPESISATLGERDALRRTETVREAAEAHGLRHRALASIIPADAKLVVRETVGDDGEPAKVATIDVGDGPVRLTDYLSGEFPEFASALAVPPPAPARPPCKGSPVPRVCGSERPRPLPGVDHDAEADRAATMAELKKSPAYSLL